MQESSTPQTMLLCWLGAACKTATLAGIERDALSEVKSLLVDEAVAEEELGHPLHASDVQEGEKIKCTVGMLEILSIMVGVLTGKA